VKEWWKVEAQGFLSRRSAIDLSIQSISVSRSTEAVCPGSNRLSYGDLEFSNHTNRAKERKEKTYRGQTLLSRSLKENATTISRLNVDVKKGSCDFKESDEKENMRNQVNWKQGVLGCESRESREDEKRKGC